jgi:hypothetical protein
MPPSELNNIPLQDIPLPTPRPTVTQPGTTGGFTPNPGHPDHALAMRTFSSDLAQAVKNQQGSVVKIAIAEDEKRRQEVIDASPTSKKNLTFIIIGLGAIILAGGIIGGVLWYKNKNASVTPVPQAEVPAIIHTETTNTLDVSGMQKNEIVPQLQAIVTEPNIRLGTMKNIIITKTTAGASVRMQSSEFLSILSSHIPADFSRSLTKEFEVGVYLYDHSNLFLVLRGSAHDYMLSGMLAWEPYMLNDLSSLFGISINETNAALLTAPFQSTIIQNRDSRAVLAEDKTPVLFYSFLDPNTAIITADPKTLTEAVRRLTQ